MPRARKTRSYVQTARAEAASESARRVLEAAGSLLMERWYDDVTLEDVAARAGVTARTVQRRFVSKENLAREFFIAAGQANAAFRDSVPVGEVDGAVAAIVGMYEEQGDAIIRYLTLELRIPLVAEVIAGGRALHRHWVERVFSPLLPEGDRQHAVTLLVVATDVYTWKLIRRDAGHSRKNTEELMRTLVNAALAPGKRRS